MTTDEYRIDKAIVLLNAVRDSDESLQNYFTNFLGENRTEKDECEIMALALRAIRDNCKNKMAFDALFFANKKRVGLIKNLSQEEAFRMLAVYTLTGIPDDWVLQ